MKLEYGECVTECKQILQYLENKVQQKMMSEVMGSSEQAALIVSEGRYDHLDINRLNSMTMSNFQQSFVQEIEDAVT